MKLNYFLKEEDKYALNFCRSGPARGPGFPVPRQPGQMAERAISQHESTDGAADGRHEQEFGQSCQQVGVT